MANCLDKLMSINFLEMRHRNPWGSAPLIHQYVQVKFKAKSAIAVYLSVIMLKYIPIRLLALLKHY